MPETKKYTVVDLFAGVGGLSYGFSRNDHFEIILANEMQKDIAKAYLQCSPQGRTRFSEACRHYDDDERWQQGYLHRLSWCQQHHGGFRGRIRPVPCSLEPVCPWRSSPRPEKHQQITEKPSDTQLVYECSSHHLPPTRRMVAVFYYYKPRMLRGEREKL